MVGHRGSRCLRRYTGLMVVFILSFLIVFTGCGKKEDKGVKERTSGGFGGRVPVPTRGERALDRVRGGTPTVVTRLV